MLPMLFIWARALGPIRVKRLKQQMLAIARALMGRPSLWGSRGAPRQHHLPAIQCRRSPSAARDGLSKHAKVEIEVVFHRGK